MVFLEKRQVFPWHGLLLSVFHTENCSAKAKPLFSLLSRQQVQSQTIKGRKFKINSSAPPALPRSDWTAACQKSLQTLKKELTHGITMAHHDFNEPFILAVHGSFNGTGAVLSQVSPGEMT